LPLAIGHNVQIGALSKADSEPDETLEWTAEEETAVRRKIDWNVVPLVTVMYLLCVCHPPPSPALVRHV
jgi:hypothetical protein